MEEKEKLFKEIITKNQFSYLQENEIYLGNFYLILYIQN